MKCPKCGFNPCLCGYAYRDMNAQGREVLAAAVLGVDVVFLRNSVSAPYEHPMKEAAGENPFGKYPPRPLI